MPLHAKFGKRGCRRFSSDVGPAMELSKGVTLIHHVLMVYLEKSTNDSSLECKGIVKSSVETWVHENRIHGVGSVTKRCRQ